jgi:hypothetical protein
MNSKGTRASTGPNATVQRKSGESMTEPIERKKQKVVIPDREDRQRINPIPTEEIESGDFVEESTGGTGPRDSLIEMPVGDRDDGEESQA